MLRTFPLYQLYLQIYHHHRHTKIPQTQLQQVSDVKGRSQTFRYGEGGHPDREIRGAVLKQFFFGPSGLS